MNSEEKKAVHRLLYAHYTLRYNVRLFDGPLENVHINADFFEMAEAIGVFFTTPPYVITHFDFAPIKAEGCAIITDWTDV